MTEPVPTQLRDVETVVAGVIGSEGTRHWSVAFGDTQLLAELVRQLPGPFGAGTVSLFGQTAPALPLLTSSEFAHLRSYTGEAGSNEARTRQLVGRKIDTVWALKDGWGGTGSSAPTPVAREIYLAAVQVLPGRYLADAQPTPTADGGLHMEWTRGRYDYSAEITSDGQLIVNVIAPNPADDREEIIETPTRDDVVRFICHGA